MVAIRKDLTADQGAVFSVTIQYTDSLEVPVNLTGYGANLHVVFSVGAANIVGTVNAQGYVSFKASDESTSTWLKGRADYYIDLLSPSGDNERLFFGIINVRPNGAVA